MKHFPSSDIGPFGRRQRHVRGHRIPVVISRGPASCNDGALIVIDAFGPDDVVSLRSSCICCTVRPKLQSTLRALLLDCEQKSFSRIAIETDEDLAPILRTFTSDRALGSDYHVEDAPALDGHHFTLTEDAPLAWDAFSRFVTTLTTLRGADLLQMKGLLNVAGCRGPIAVYCMGHLTARPIELQAWPEGERASRIELVTRNIDEKMVRDLFDSVRALA